MHPLAPSVERQLAIDQSNMSHLITKIWFEENLLKGIVETTLTERGKDMQGLIRQGMQVAFSMRGIGPVSEKRGDITYIKDPLHILTYDWVIHPSHKPAYMDKVIKESYNPLGLNNLITESSEPYFIPLKEEEIRNFIISESSNVKSLTDQFEFSTKNCINREKNLIYFQEGYDILAVYLEDYIAKDIDNYLSRL